MIKMKHLIVLLFAIYVAESASVLDNEIEEDNEDGNEIDDEQPESRGAKCEWAYEDNKYTPDKWGMKYAMCNGMKQSPIDLTNAMKKTDCSKFTFTKYDQKYKFLMGNNGHTAVYSIDGGATPMVCGGCLNANCYKFAQFHFHWGLVKKDKSGKIGGSEHTIDGERYPAELHLVHYRADFKDLNAAIADGSEDALAVLGIMLEEATGKGLNQKTKPYDELFKISQIKKIRDNGDEALFAKERKGKKSKAIVLALEEFLPENQKKFYRYQGSLTTPTCNEIVTWTVFKQPRKFSAQQWKNLRSLKDCDGNLMKINFREPQPLNSRDLYCIEVP